MGVYMDRESALGTVENFNDSESSEERNYSFNLKQGGAFSDNR